MVKGNDEANAASGDAANEGNEEGRGGNPPPARYRAPSAALTFRLTNGCSWVGFSPTSTRRLCKSSQVPYSSWRCVVIGRLVIGRLVVVVMIGGDGWWLLWWVGWWGWG